MLIFYFLTSTIEDLLSSEDMRSVFSTKWSISIKRLLLAALFLWKSANDLYNRFSSSGSPLDDNSKSTDDVGELILFKLLKSIDGDILLTNLLLHLLLGHNCGLYDQNQSPKVIYLKLPALIFPNRTLEGSVFGDHLVIFSTLSFLITMGPSLLNSTFEFGLVIQGYNALYIMTAAILYAPRSASSYNQLCNFPLKC